ncbi:dnaA [Acrasis kona]|uniref:DnaA n=1 Tax=Acrasis kona TaxID=1008807 RepID=A0AAW2Z5I3_9EUKA
MGGHHEERPGTEHPKPKRFEPWGMHRSTQPPHIPFNEAVLNYRDNLHKTFRFTGRTALQAVLIGLVIPLVVYTNSNYHRDDMFRTRFGYEPPKTMNAFGWAGASATPTYFDDMDLYTDKHDESQFKNKQ